ncbi:hypothetical protein [Hymenobacter cavernae]|uniref:Uncharacterized protein n=1 Tax=Hymenobacter cavernae TaxID=2044852 RepID=A0ABQ1U3Q9_9BACT|nr:hypothetical protein [Hymenobacter cavernae]GGF08580.1 hypothetical protein GCM10011383_19670 [Hymenobacter cavernae]
MKVALGSAPGVAVDSVALNKLLEPWQGMHWRVSSVSTQIVAYEAPGGRPVLGGTDAKRCTAFVSVLMYHTPTS